MNQVYSLLVLWTVCEVQAKCCILPCINLICSDASDYVGNKIIGGEIQRHVPYLFLSNIPADEHPLYSVVLLPGNCLNPVLNNHGLGC